MDFDVSKLQEMLGPDPIGRIAIGMIGVYMTWKGAKWAFSKTIGGVASLMGSSFKAANASPAALAIIGGTSMGAAFDGIITDGNCYTLVGLGASSLIVGGIQYLIKTDRGDYKGEKSETV